MHSKNKIDGTRGNDYNCWYIYTLKCSVCLYQYILILFEKERIRVTDRGRARIASSMIDGACKKRSMCAHSLLSPPYNNISNLNYMYIYACHTKIRTYINIYI